MQIVNEITYQDHNGQLSFATDGWMSLNHKAYVAITVHFEDKGVMVAMSLDIIEMAQIHSGINLATAFSKVLTDFGISHKVSIKL